MTSSNMSAGHTVERSLHEKHSDSALLVLGMHRSGTSAITGALRLCGAWVGEETELIAANAENPQGFWERRDMRQICDRLLHATGADWWKVSSFDPKAIPHAILAEQRRAFARIISALDEHGTWAVKEPRLCLLLPVLRDYITDPVCIHIVRHPLEVARSLRIRNGFSIAAGFALWETYNRRALSASENLPYVLVSYESLMLNPVETLDGLLARLDEFAITNLVRPDEDRLTRFITPSLYRHKATEEEAEEYLAPSQYTLWRQLREGHVPNHDGNAPVSRVTRQYLLDLESVEISLNYHKDRADELGKRAKAIHTIKRRADELQNQADELQNQADELQNQADELQNQADELQNQADELQNQADKLSTEIEARDIRINNIYNSTSWRITAPIRAISRKYRWFLRNIRRMFVLTYWLGTGQFPRAIRAAFPYYMKLFPRRFDKWIPKQIQEYARLALSFPVTELPNHAQDRLFSETRRKIRISEASFQSGNFSDSLAHWQELELFAQSSDDDALSGTAKLMVSVTGRLSDVHRYRKHIEYYSELSNRRRQSGNDIRIVIFTAIAGNYDSIKLPEQLNPSFDYVLFTDSSVPETGIWQIRPITYLHSDKARSTRFVKTHPHVLLDNYDIAVWIDSNIMILNDIRHIVDGLLSSGKSIGAIPHPLRKTIYEEITACIDREKDDIGVMREQIIKYQKECFSHSDLIESNFMIFDLRDKKVAHFLDSWWREIDCHSKRDQLSLNYALSKTGIDWHRLTKRPDSIRNHPDFAFVSHDNGTGPSTKLIEALQTVTIDPYDGPSYAEIKQSRIRGHETRTIDIIVCVHDALDDVRHCLESISKTRNTSQHRLIIIDDGSESLTAEYLSHFADVTPYCELHRNEVAQGYPKAANRGLAASAGELVILLNSDTIVTDSWIEKLADAIFSTPGAGIAGPLSNAASYQSIPEYRGRDGQTAINTLLHGLTPEDMNSYCERWTKAHVLPRVPLIHGFCFCITRQLIDQIGYFDEENFPRGYGEENDYCFRAKNAGFGLVVATHTYIFHSKSRSYADHERIPLMKAASRRFRGIHGHSQVRRAERSMAENPILAVLRAHAKNLELESR